MPCLSTLARLVCASAALAAGGAHAATVLFVQDELPWGLTSDQDVLDSLGVSYKTVTSAQLADVNFANFATIIISSNQPQTFYDNLATNAQRLDRWVSAGAHTLEFHGAAIAPIAWTFALPRNVTGFSEWSTLDTVLKPSSPLMVGVPKTIKGGTYPSIYSFDLGTVTQGKVVTDADSGNPTTLDYCHGPGRVIATGVTVEFGWRYDLNYAQMLPNMMSASTGTPGCPAQ